ncbi:MAG TPA: metallophosphoesterase family protein [Solirubrobacteraceae bacterium]|nr:metallophosphoesterase family protein [Solirubrobacteraceae bacterium]
MRVAVLNDIHGNLPALDAVLAEVDRAGVDAIVVGGDLAWGPLPLQTLERLMALDDRSRFVMGNADRDVVEAFDGGTPEHEAVSAYCAARISQTHRDFLAGLSPPFALDVDGLGPSLFCHGSPRSDTERITTATPDARLRRILEDVSESLVVCGHTHRQFDRRIDAWRVVNAGAVGLPYEGRAAAFWALLGPEVELRCTDYDIAGALEVFRASGMTDDVEREMRLSLFDPADPDEVAEYFESRAGSDA